VRALVDECLPRRLARLLAGHEATTVAEMGWAGTRNGALLRLAEPRFDALLTIDQNLRFQQDVHGLNVAVVMLVARSNRLSDLEPLLPELLRVLSTIGPGELASVGETR
jgi:predicted nuclease of predicted toxin-antitoxin system